MALASVPRLGQESRAMQVGKLLGPDVGIALGLEPEGVAEALQELHVQDLAELLAELSDAEVAQLVGMLPIDVSADVLCRMQAEQAAGVVALLADSRAAQVLRAMAADDRADLIQQLAPELAERLLLNLGTRSPEVAEETRALVSYGEDTAGGIMTTEYVAFGPELSVGQALERVRQIGRQRALEVVYYAYVVAYERLIGVVSLRDLLLARDNEIISDVMTSNVVSVDASTDQEEVAHTITKYELAALPVVEDDGRLIGIVTIDDVVDVIREEASEDQQKMAGLVPTEEKYFDVGFRSNVRSRVTWLTVLFVLQFLTASVMKMFEGQVSLVMDLILFVPLIISSGGNSGSQSPSLIIRALALGEMAPRDWPRVLAKEAVIGIALGALLSFAGFARAMLGSSPETAYAMGLTVAISVVAVVTLGTLVGSLMPLAIKRLGLDPAVSSTPFVASIVDVLGLFLYFTVARVMFAILM
jgi:magnesium transporter